MHRRSRRRDGFTLIELLMVVAIIGILAAIAIPNLLNAINRSKQKRTMADIRYIAGTWEAFQTDTGRYVAAGAAFTWPTTPVLYADLSTLLIPTYARTIPRLDGWNGAFELAVTGDQSYGIRSAGKDGSFEGSSYPGTSVSRFDCDIVYSNGSFAQYPEGVISE